MREKTYATSDTGSQHGHAGQPANNITSTQRPESGMIIRTSGRDLDELKRFIDVAKANEETEIRVRFPTHIDAARRYAREKGKLRVHIMQRS